MLPEKEKRNEIAGQFLTVVTSERELIIGVEIAFNLYRTSNWLVALRCVACASDSVGDSGEVGGLESGTDTELIGDSDAALLRLSLFGSRRSGFISSAHSQTSGPFHDCHLTPTPAAARTGRLFSFLPRIL